MKDKFLYLRYKINKMKRLGLFLLAFTTLLLSSANARAACHAKFGYTVSGYGVSFSDSSSAVGSYTRSWSFGDGTTSDGHAPSHTYTAYGTYTVCLKIVDTTNHCDDKYCVTVTIAKNGHCNAAFTFTDSSGTVHFTADTANGHHAKFGWNFGDGTHSADRNPKHTYSKPGVYTVCMEVADSPCSDRQCHDITIGHPSYCITGNVYASKHNAYPGYVYLYKFNPADSTWHVVDTASLDSANAGHYEFGHVEQGTYIVLAGVDSTSAFYKNYLPTYYGHTIKWHDATQIIIYNSCAEHRDIYLHERSSHSGKGHVKGHAHNGHKKQGLDAGLNILLLNANDSLVDWTTSDAYGDFEFAKVDNGKYKVYLEFTGLPTSPALVEISDANPVVSGVDIQVSQSAVISAVQGTTQVSMLSSITVYPNPVTAGALNLNLRSEQNSGLTISIYDLNGRIMRTINEHVNSGLNQYSFDISHLNSGMYFLTLQAKDGIAQRIKIIKE